MIGMPVVAAFAGDADRTEAIVLIVGSAGSGLITIVSLRIRYEDVYLGRAILIHSSKLGFPSVPPTHQI
jgi:hypothetical protein